MAANRVGTIESAVRCLACRSTELQHEIGDRWQCQNCGFRQLINEAGKVRDWLPWRSAGRRVFQKRKRRSPKYKRGGCPLRW